MKRLIIVLLILLTLSGIAQAAMIVAGCGLPSTKTVQVRIYDITDAVEDVAWTVTGVTERADGQGSSCYYYSATLETAHAYQIDWKDNSTLVQTASEILPQNSISTVTVGTNQDKTGYTASTVSDKTGYTATCSTVSDKTGYTVSTVQDKTGYTSTCSTVSDKTGYSLSQTFPTNFADLAITSSTGKVTVGTNSDKSDYVLTSAYDAAKTAATQTSVNAIPTNPTLQTMWTDAKAGYLTGAVALQASVDDLESRLTATRAGYLDNLSGGAVALASSALTAANVWDYNISAYIDAGKAGTYLKAAASAGDPWSTSLPGVYGIGSAGYIVGTNLNATVGSRLPTSSYTAPDNTNIGNIWTETQTHPTIIEIEASTVLAKQTSVDDLEGRLSATRAGYLDNLSGGAVALNSTVAKEATLANATYGLSALKDLVDTIDTSTELQARFTELKGTGWTTETLKVIKDTLASGVTVSSNTDKTGYALSAAGVDAIHDEVIEGTLTARQLSRVLLAVLAGKSSGGGTTTILFKGKDGTTTRVTAYVDSNGNRTAVTINGE